MLLLFLRKTKLKKNTHTKNIYRVRVLKDSSSTKKPSSISSVTSTLNILKKKNEMDADKQTKNDSPVSVASKMIFLWILFFFIKMKKGRDHHRHHHHPEREREMAK